MFPIYLIKIISNLRDKDFETKENFFLFKANFTGIVFNSIVYLPCDSFLLATAAALWDSYSTNMYPRDLGKQIHI